MPSKYVPLDRLIDAALVNSPDPYSAATEIEHLYYIHSGDVPAILKELTNINYHSEVETITDMYYGDE